MSSRRYFISENNIKINYGKLLYISHSVDEGEWPSISHSHYFSEVFFIINGEGTFEIEGNFIDVKSNDIIIMNPNINHNEISFASNRLEYYVLGIEDTKFDFKNEKNKVVSKSYSLSNFLTIRNETIFYFDELIKELEKKEDFHINKANNLYQIIFSDLLKISKYTANAVTNKQILKECVQTKRYIDSNYSDKITLETLAEKAHLNKFYLSHTFAEAYGISPINYLISVRLNVSKDLLVSTDYNIAEIAQTCGFSSQSYFSQSFKKHTNITPASYRKRNRDIFKKVKGGR